VTELPQAAVSAELAVLEHVVEGQWLPSASGSMDFPLPSVENGAYPCSVQLLQCFSDVVNALGCRAMSCFCLFQVDSFCI